MKTKEKSLVFHQDNFLLFKTNLELLFKKNYMIYQMLVFLNNHTHKCHEKLSLNVIVLVDISVN